MSVRTDDACFGEDTKSYKHDLQVSLGFTALYLRMPLLWGVLCRKISGCQNREGMHRSCALLPGVSRIILLGPPETLFTK